MSFEVIKKRIPIISSGKFGHTNYYISKEILKKYNIEDKLANSCLAYYTNNEEHPVGCFPDDGRVYIEYNNETDEIDLFAYANIWHDFDLGLTSEIRQGNILFTPEITINKTHECENGTIEIDEFELLYILAYDKSLDERDL